MLEIATVTIWLSCAGFSSGPTDLSIRADFDLETFQVPDRKTIPALLLSKTKDIPVPVNCEIRYSVTWSKKNTEPGLVTPKKRE